MSPEFITESWGQNLVETVLDRHLSLDSLCIVNV